jgi:gamma-glutamyltranspeptidase/glutathione hydrolase
MRPSPKQRDFWPQLVVAALFAFLTVAAFCPAGAEETTARHGMVVAQEARAARIGLEVLKKGGNAVDAAVATGFALAVTYPRAGNIGGGGYMVIHLAAGKRDIAIDYREIAPQATTRDIFLDRNGEADPEKSHDSALAIGVPGTVAGLALAERRYGSGRFTLADLIKPAIALAREGIPVADDTADSLPLAREALKHWPSSAKIFLDPQGNALAEGAILMQSDLAATLETIAREGPRGFYEGAVAEKLVAAIRAAGGIMTLDDLRSYRPVVRAPVRGSYRDYRIVSMPPSSSGGVVLIEMLNILERYRLGALDTGARDHLMVEAMRRAFADRAAYLGDPAVVTAPLQMLLSKGYAAKLRAGIDPDRATPSNEIRPELAAASEGDNTTHFSVVDRYGNAVATTTTINSSYGVGLVAEGTGILLNNELDDFAAKAGAPNASGLLGGDANAPGPGKRPLSSMTPTIVLRNGKPFLVTGSPGSARIITTVLQIIVDEVDLKLPIGEAVAAKRFHNQWWPDQIMVERGFSADAMAALEARGHEVVEYPPWSSANSIRIGPLGFSGAADPRSRGALATGY